MLRVENLNTGYNKKQVLFGINIEVGEGKVVGLIGPNGAGKSTVLKAVFGIVPIWRGKVSIEDRTIRKPSPMQSIQNGIAYSPQGNRVFGELSVLENIEVAGFGLPQEQVQNTVNDLLELFPSLRDRLSERASRLSGGEQQMVCLARSLLRQPKILILDEPSVGLAPALVTQVLSKVRQIVDNRGIAAFVVEQKVRELLKISDYVYSMKFGKITFSGLPDELKGNRELLRDLFL